MGYEAKVETVEKKSFHPVCDGCGVVARRISEVFPDDAKSKALKTGWEEVSFDLLLCRSCVDGLRNGKTPLKGGSIRDNLQEAYITLEILPIYYFAGGNLYCGACLKEVSVDLLEEEDPLNRGHTPDCWYNNSLAVFERELRRDDERTVSAPGED